MNVALKDIRHNAPRFLITVLGVGLLIAASAGMVGLYRGVVEDATLLIEEIGADYWVVQGGRAGPFAEPSIVSANMDRRVEALAGVARVRRFLQTDQQLRRGDRQVRATVVALDAPKDAGDWLRLIEGRRIASSRYEAIADRSLGFAIGDQVAIGRDQYEIVGLTSDMVSGMGDGLLFVTVNDALEIAQRKANEEVLLARATTGREALPAESRIAAILIELDFGADEAALRETVRSWGDANILSADEQRDLFLNQRLWKLRVQILAFTGVLLTVTTIVIALIVYMMTLEKLREISLLKLIGAPHRMIVSMIVQQALLIGFGGYLVGLALSGVLFPYFPRRVVLDPMDLLLLFLAVLAIGLVAAQFGVARAMKARPQDVLS